MALYERELIVAESATASIPGSGGEARRQDAVASLVGDHGQLFVVADGHEDTGWGGRAAELVVETVLNFFRRWDGRGARKMLVEAVGMANSAMRRAAEKDAHLKDVAVSATLMHYHDNALRIVHVGKCRAYRQRNYVIDQLTADHTSQVGDFSRAAGPIRNPVIVLDRAIGLSPIVEVDVSDANFVQPGETYLICSDGLTAHLNDVEIGRYCLAGEPAKVCDALLGLAGEHSDEGSISLGMIKFSAQASQPQTSTDFDNPIGPSSMRLGTDIPVAGFSFGELSPLWKVRIILLGVLVAWFALLVVAWVGFDRNEASMLWPLLIGLAFSTAPLVMMFRWRRGRKGGRKL